MQNITLIKSNAGNLAEAGDEAVGAVIGEIDAPVVFSWLDDKTQSFAPDIPGGDPKQRWRDYGESLGGTHEVEVADRFHFIIGDASGFTEPKVPFSNMKDSNGREYLCLNASGDDAMKRPLDQVYPAGGGRGADS